ncbi:MAG TPA: hypothetical protein VHC19_07325 [Pirellulales bacterium]|nr:hypothetical protein [Pirellulales bacterium]
MKWLNAENDGLTKLRVASGVKVVTGSLAWLAADARHSVGSNLAKWLNVQCDGLSARTDERRIAVATGSLAGLAADARHSTGAKTVLRLNAENDGLSQAGDARAAIAPPPARRDRRANIERPTWIGFAVFAYRQARGAMHNGELRGRSGQARAAVANSHKLAASGWSGCAAYSLGADPWGRSVCLAGPDEGLSDRPWVAQITASLLGLPAEVAPNLTRVGSRIADTAALLWAGTPPRPALVKPVGVFGQHRRWARFHANGTSGL